jgi:pullulanase
MREVAFRRRTTLAVYLLLGLLLNAVGVFSPVPQQVATAQAQPNTVTIPGTIQSKLGCSADWKPDCSNTYLTYNKDWDIWVGGPWDLPAGEYEYKVAINNGWDENYGKQGARGGGNITLSLSSPAKLKFYFDYKTKLVADTATPVPVVIGNFQSKIGCGGDNKADCLKGWLQSPRGDGNFSWTTNAIPEGNYDARVALGEAADNVYGVGGAKGGEPVKFNVPFAGAALTFKFNGKTNELTVGPAQQGSLDTATAHWVTRDTIAWKVEGKPENQYKLVYEPGGALKLNPSGIEGGNSVNLTYDPAGLPQAVLQKFPHLKDFTALKIGAADVAKVPDILKGQIAVQGSRGADRLLDATLLQIPGVLDDLFPYDGKLGVVWEGDVPELRVWSPLARKVNVFLFDAADARERTETPMIYDAKTGVWSLKGQANWKNKYYIYQVEVFVPATNKVETNLVTDPYSVSLSANSFRSQIVNLADADLAPTGWTGLKKPELAAPEDIVLYELHVRDFSASDATVPEAKRGTYAAFTEPNSNGMKHLKALQAAGLTHVHLLPVFDLATVNEVKAERKEADPKDLSGAVDAETQQAAIDKFRDQDAFNWGYDPLHYGVPEGSYASDANGTVRVKEFREMVKALNENNLRVVMDVVYNHTSASGQDLKSVLDRIVPGYYHRLNGEGRVENSTCCANTATEHRMMEKLMVDTLVSWVKDYKVDAFRFDLMGHHLVSNMQKVRQAFDALTPEKDGVDGKKIYIYGEGWNFGEVADNKRGQNATQINMAGTGIGTFNDRLRDAARGGGPFSGLQEQGFATGLLSLPNPDSKQGDTAKQRDRLLEYTDWIKVGLAGNLKEYKFTDRTGKSVTGAQVDYNGAPAGYNLDPQENIVYTEAHDNETFFDAMAFKAPAGTPLATRVRLQNMGISLVGFSQGIPFLHAGQDLLRSKSLDRDSYNSADHFNRLDFSFQSNNFGVGLPPKGKNEENWPIMKKVLADTSNKATEKDIRATAAHTQEILQIRKSSPLFRLQTATDVQNRLKFVDGVAPGVIAMSLSDVADRQLDPNYRYLMVVFNGTNQAQTVKADGFVRHTMALHPILQNGADAEVKKAVFDSATGSFSVPPFTTAVFVERDSDPQPPAVAQLGSQAPASGVPAQNPAQGGAQGSQGQGGQPQAPASGVPAAGVGGASATDGSNTFVIWLLGLSLVAVGATFGLRYVRRK